MVNTVGIHEGSKLRTDPVLVDFIEREALPGTGVDPEQFWNGLAEMVDQFEPRRRELLAVRESLQSSIDQWHREHAGQDHDPIAYRDFLSSIG